MNYSNFNQARVICFFFKKEKKNEEKEKTKQKTGQADKCL